MAEEKKKLISTGLVSTEYVYNGDDHYPNVDYYYGPYESKDAAWDVLSNNDFNVIGMTVGVIEGGSIVEYWFKSGTNRDDLVKKMPEVNAGNVDLSNYYTKSETYNKSDLYVKSEVYNKTEVDTIITGVNSYIATESEGLENYVDNSIGDLEKFEYKNNCETVVEALNALSDKSGIGEAPTSEDASQQKSYVRCNKGWKNIDDLDQVGNAFVSIAKTEETRGITWTFSRNKTETQTQRSSIYVPYATTTTDSSENKTYNGGMMTSAQYKKYEGYDSRISNAYNLANTTNAKLNSRIVSLVESNKNYTLGFVLKDGEGAEKGSWSVTVAHKVEDPNDKNPYKGGVLSSYDYQALCEAVTELKTKQENLQYYDESEGYAMFPEGSITLGGQSGYTEISHYDESGLCIVTTVEGGGVAEFRIHPEDFEINCTKGRPYNSRLLLSGGEVKLSGTQTITFSNSRNSVVLGEYGLYLNDRLLETEEGCYSRISNYAYSKTDIDERFSSVNASIANVGNTVSDYNSANAGEHATINSKIGTLEDLNTSVQTDLVSAINEVANVKAETVGENLVDGTAEQFVFNIPGDGNHIVKTPYKFGARGYLINEASVVGVRIKIENIYVGTQPRLVLYNNNSTGERYELLKINNGVLVDGNEYYINVPVSNVPDENKAGDYSESDIMLFVGGVNSGKITISELKVENPGDKRKSTKWCISEGDKIAERINIDTESFAKKTDLKDYATQSWANSNFISRGTEYEAINSNYTSLKGRVDTLEGKVPTRYSEGSSNATITVSTENKGKGTLSVDDGSVSIYAYDDGGAIIGSMSTNANSAQIKHNTQIHLSSTKVTATIDKNVVELPKNAFDGILFYNMSNPYQAGDIVIFSGNLIRFKTAIAAGRVPEPNSYENISLWKLIQELTEKLNA